jgi:hypothetical protein
MRSTPNGDQRKNTLVQRVKNSRDSSVINA